MNMHFEVVSGPLFISFHFSVPFSEVEHIRIVLSDPRNDKNSPEMIFTGYIRRSALSPEYLLVSGAQKSFFVFNTSVPQLSFHAPIFQFVPRGFSRALDGSCLLNNFGYLYLRLIRKANKISFRRGFFSSFFLEKPFYINAGSRT